MKDNELTWEIVNSEYKGQPLFYKYCNLNSCCEDCNKKVRFWCKVKDRIMEHQEKIIRKILDERSDNNVL